MHYAILLHRSPVDDLIIFLAPRIMADDEAAPPLRNHRGGRVPGHANYQNNILIPIIERILPNGAEAWHLDAIVYKVESGEHKLHTEEDLCNNWVSKLCNRLKNPQAAPVTLLIGFTIALR